jgi:hypothetical protein
MRVLIVDCDTYSESAAEEIVPPLTTARNVSICSKFIYLQYIYIIDIYYIFYSLFKCILSGYTETVKKRTPMERGEKQHDD